MLKKTLCAILLIAFILTGTSACSIKPGKQKLHVAFVTDSKENSIDHFLAAQTLIKKYGSVDSGGMIKHVEMDDSCRNNPDKVSDTLAALADDPDLEIVVVCIGLEGTSDGFSRIKNLKPRVFCFVIDSLEDTDLIERTADFIIDCDVTNTGYLIPWVAKQLGARNFVHVSFERHLNIDILSRRRLIMKAACEKHGLEFYDKYAPDPYEVDEADVLKYLRKKMPMWIEELGTDTAFFCTQNLHTDEIIRQVAKYGAIFVQQDLPSPVMGYKDAFDLDVDESQGNYKAMIETLEKKLSSMPGNKRMGTWAYSYENAAAKALVEYGIELKKSDYYETDLTRLVKCLKDASDGAHWNVFFSYNHLSRTAKSNRVEVYQDTYVLNKGPIDMSKIMIPNLFDMCEDYLEFRNESTDPRDIFENTD